MKYALLSYFLFSSICLTRANHEEVIARVIFEYSSNQKSITGTFKIVETNERFDITSFQPFEITLPKMGKYHFEFITSQFFAILSHPTKITKVDNIITIKLFPINATHQIITNLTDEQLGNLINEGKVNFIMHSFINNIPEEYVNFKEKYGIGLLIENCVIDPLSMQRARENNQRIASYLTTKYGDTLLNDMNLKPFGI